MKITKTALCVVLAFGVLIVLTNCNTKKILRPDVSGETWDYVILGSSIGTWWAEYYGDLVESDLGVELLYHNYYVGSQTVSELLFNIRNMERLREDIQKAEVITIGVGCADMFTVIETFGADGFLKDPKRIKEKLDEFRETYDSMLTELLSLTSPTDTIIRTMDFYYPYVGIYQARGIYNQNKQYWQEFNKCIVQVSQKYGIPVAKVFEAFHGPQGNDDPVEKGYLDGWDIHSSEEGEKVIAAEFQKLGYEYASP